MSTHEPNHLPGDPAQGPAGEPTHGSTGEPATATPGGGRHGGGSGGGSWSKAKETALVVVIALVVSTLVKTFLLQPFWIPSGSMETTLEPGDRIVVNKLAPRFTDLHRGDVVVFKDPSDWLGREGGTTKPGPLKRGLQFVGLYPGGDQHLVKRVIGMPGDKVRCCSKDGHLVVNGTPIDEPYVDGRTDQKKFSITVPQGRVWVMGDNRGDSLDSRFHDDGTGTTGSVPIDDVTGRAFVVLWPRQHIGWLHDPTSTFAKVPSP